VTENRNVKFLTLDCVVIMERLIVSLDFLEFPPTHTCEGENISPRLLLKGLNAASVAVMVFNPFNKSCCSYSPWIIWNLPPVTVIPAGVPPQGIVTEPIAAVQGISDNGKIGYTGPCPPHGEMIRTISRCMGSTGCSTLNSGPTNTSLFQQ
jgi:Raf kinase inhibitor-like YbhB/YbcL family protein